MHQHGEVPVAAASRLSASAMSCRARVSSSMRIGEYVSRVRRVRSDTRRGSCRAAYETFKNKTPLSWRVLSLMQTQAEQDLLRVIRNDTE